MKKNLKKVIFYTGIYLIMIVFAIVGLIYNIKTVTLNHENQLLIKKIDLLSEENHKLYLKSLSLSRLSRLDQIATRHQLEKPKKIVYISAPKK